MEVQLRGLSVEAAKGYIEKLRSKGGCKEFHKLIAEIRGAVQDKAISYHDIGITEIELLELGAENASTVILKGISSTFGDFRLVSIYACEKTRLRAKSTVAQESAMATA